jgi:hypothetical protein
MKVLPAAILAYFHFYSIGGVFAIMEANRAVEGDIGTLFGYEFFSLGSSIFH